MAWGSVGSLGGTQSSAADQASIVLTTTATLEAGNVGVLLVAVDNHATTDADHSEVSGVVDSAGNTWLKAAEFTNGRGAAKGGTTGSIWYVKAGTQLASGGTITASFTNTTSRDKSAAVAWEFTIGAGNTVSVQATNASANNGGGPQSIDVTTPNAEFLRVRIVAMETDQTGVMTATGSWTVIPHQVTSGGAAAANQRVGGEFRIFTGTNAASDPSDFATADNVAVIVALKEATSNQTLTPSLFTAAQTFFTQTVGVGAVGLTPSLFSNAQSFFTQNVAAKLTADLFSNAQTFFTQTVGVGSVGLTAALFTDTDTFFSPTVAATYAITADLFTDGDTFFTQTVAVGAVALTPSLFTAAQSFFTQTVAVGAVDLAAALFSNAPTFFTQTVEAEGGTQDLTPSLFSNAQTFFEPTVGRGAVDLAASLFANDSTFYSATLAVGAVNLAPSLFSNAHTFFSPTVATGAVALEPSLFSNAQTFFSPTVEGGVATLLPSLFASTNTFFAATVGAGAVDLSPSLFANDNTFFGPTVAGVEAAAERLPGGGSSSAKGKRKTLTLKRARRPEEIAEERRRRLLEEMFAPEKPAQNITENIPAPSNVFTSLDYFDRAMRGVGVARVAPVEQVGRRERLRQERQARALRMQAAQEAAEQAEQQRIAAERFRINEEEAALVLLLMAA